MSPFHRGPSLVTVYASDVQFVAQTIEFLARHGIAAMALDRPVMPHYHHRGPCTCTVRIAVPDGQAARARDLLARRDGHRRAVVAVAVREARRTLAGVGVLAVVVLAVLLGLGLPLRKAAPFAVIAGLVSLLLIGGLQRWREARSRAS